ncbi:MAG: aminodeoxychorismate lyase [Spongiibacteraceae bacterium]
MNFDGIAVELFALYNGKPTNSVPLSDRGFAYGDGLFETIKVVDGHAQFLAEHLRRLERDCARLDMALESATLRSEVFSLLSAKSSGVLKIIATRYSTQRGYAASSRARAERFLRFYPQQFPIDIPAREGVAVRLCRQRLSEQAALAGMKHLNRLEQVLARQEWSDNAIAEGLMLDAAGRLIEGTMSNLFLVKSGCVMTPRLHRCGVAGVMRDVIMRQLSERCVPVSETDLTLDDLYAADEVFLSNSLIGIWPVRKIECIHKTIGAVTVAFQTALSNLITEQSIR